MTFTKEQRVHLRALVPRIVRTVLDWIWPAGPAAPTKEGSEP